MNYKHGVWVAVAFAAIAGLFAANSANVSGQQHRVLFELTSGEGESWPALLNNIENVRKTLGEKSTDVEVVAHGKGLDFLRRSNTQLSSRMQNLAGSNVVFMACENTMRRQNVTKADLLPFVTTVDSGVAQVVRRQEAGWSYVRTGG